MRGVRHARDKAEADSGAKTAARGFAWWGPHDHARHSAELLLALVSAICAAYGPIKSTRCVRKPSRRSRTAPSR